MNDDFKTNLSLGAAYKYFIVARPGFAGEVLCGQINKEFGCALHFPTLAFAPPDDAAAFERAISECGNQDWLIFNSVQAVVSVVPSLRACWPNLPENVKFAAVGRATVEALKAAGYMALYPQTEWSSESLLAMPQFTAPAGQRIMMMRGQGGRELLEKIFLERGAIVSSCLAYKRVLPDTDASECESVIKNHRCCAIIAGSFETVTNLKSLLGDSIWPELAKVPLIVMSERIKALADGLGFQSIWVTKSASQQAVLDLIAEKKDVLCPRIQK